MKWLFLVHQVQTPNSRERVKVWRLIKKVGALLYRNSVYVLPFSKEHLEDFQWICQQIRDSKGEASVFISESPDTKEDRALTSLFKKSRQQDYENLTKSAAALLQRVQTHSEGKLPENTRRIFERELTQLSESLDEISRIDFFSAGTPKDLIRITDKLKKTLAETQPSARKPLPLKRSKKAEFQGKTWATREEIHVDRLASAWFIRRFIDPTARFLFAAENSLPHDAILFDVFGAEFSHRGDDCTLETLLKSFGMKDAGLNAIAQIIHDIDLKDHKFGRPEAAGLDAAIRALRTSLHDDFKLLEAGSVILDGLYKDYSRGRKK